MARYFNGKFNITSYFFEARLRAPKPKKYVGDVQHHPSSLKYLHLLAFHRHRPVNVVGYDDERFDDNRQQSRSENVVDFVAKLFQIVFKTAEGFDVLG